MCSLIPRRIWKDGKIVRASDSYGKWAGDAAAQENVGFIDLNEIIARKYDVLGAEINADSVVEGLKTLKNDRVAEWMR